MFVEDRPKLGDSVIFWTAPALPEQPLIANHAVVCNVAKEGNHPLRPVLTLAIFLAENGKVRSRTEVEAVEDTGGVPIALNRYSLPGEYEINQ